MKHHELKCWLSAFEEVALGVKTFEARKDDRGFNRGDVLQLREFDQYLQEYTGRTISARVTYLLRGSTYGLGDDLVVMQIRVFAFRSETGVRLGDPGKFSDLSL